jgi:hypothetical protein
LVHENMIAFGCMHLQIQHGFAEEHDGMAGKMK